MNTNPNPMRGRLLERVEPDPATLARYRAEVDAMLAQKEKSLKWQKWYAGVAWIYCVLLTTAFLLAFGFYGDTPRWVIVLGTMFALLIAAAVELGKYFLNRVRLELLKEIKGLELLIRTRDAGGNGLTGADPS